MPWRKELIMQNTRLQGNPKYNEFNKQCLVRSCFPSFWSLRERKYRFEAPGGSERPLRWDGDAGSGPGPQLVWLLESPSSRALSLLVAVNPLANPRAPPHPSQVDSISPSVGVFIPHFSCFASDCFGVTQPFSHSSVKETSSRLKDNSPTVRFDHLLDSTCRHHVWWWLCTVLSGAIPPRSGVWGQPTDQR